MPRKSRAAALALLPFFLSGCARNPQPHPLANDAYIWQRLWNDALLTAIRQSAPSIRAWRVLAAEADAKADLLPVAVNRAALAQMSNPVVAVFRIDGRIDKTPLDDKLAAEIAALTANWKQAGVPVGGVEIDYDCATSRLSRYRDFLVLLRKRIPPGMTLSITALPSWIGSADLPKLLTAVDDSVLQVHSVMNPQKGLFDRNIAAKWAHSWSTQSPKPFRLALPTYWSRVTWNESGRVVSIESEADAYATESPGRELIVEPRQVAALLADLRRAPPLNLIGIAWFRLPLATDQRAWSLQTWRAVMSGQPLEANLPVVHFRNNQKGARDVYLRNEGGLDVKLPSQVSISSHDCEFADAIPPYNLQRQPNLFRFVLQADDLLRSGDERLIGWIRCSNSKLDAHVEF